MLEFIRSLFSGLSGSTRDPQSGTHREHVPPPAEVLVEGKDAFVFSAHWTIENEFPILDWEAAQEWLDTIVDETQRSAACTRLRKGWLEHMRQALGPHYALHETEHAMLVSSQEDHVAKATLGFVRRTQQRIESVLDGISLFPEDFSEALIVFDDKPEYYGYLSHCYDGEEIRNTDSVLVTAGEGHLVMLKADLGTLEPLIARHLTHACLLRLPLPVWLNAGIATHMEQRLYGHMKSQTSPMQMHARHQAFWDAQEIQGFWNAESFGRSDNSNELSYDLARILVSQMSRDWPAFRAFVLEADWNDGGAAAAITHLQRNLGEIVAAVLERTSSCGLEPDPSQWKSALEDEDSVAAVAAS
jgi:hypothetical protein